MDSWRAEVGGGECRWREGEAGKRGEGGRQLGEGLPCPVRMLPRDGVQAGQVT